jgi:hypothetical protein
MHLKPVCTWLLHTGVSWVPVPAGTCLQFPFPNVWLPRHSCTLAGNAPLFGMVPNSRLRWVLTCCIRRRSVSGRTLWFCVARRFGTYRLPFVVGAPKNAVYAGSGIFGGGTAGTHRWRTAHHLTITLSMEQRCSSASCWCHTDFFRLWR